MSTEQKPKPSFWTWAEKNITGWGLLVALWLLVLLLSGIFD